MIRKCFKLLLQIAGLLLVLTGCQSSLTPIPAVVTPASTPTLVPGTYVVTATAAPIAATAATILTPTPTPVFPTVTSLPTPNAEIETYFREMLKTNGGCKLPCWWGIVPGQTEWAETQLRLQRLGLRIANVPSSDGSVYHGTSGFDFRGLLNSIGFSEQSGIVESIRVSADWHNDPQDFRATWTRYSPSQVILAHGPPDRVWIEIAALFPERTYDSIMPYMLWLLYERQGFLVKYTSGVSIETVYHFCPGLQTETAGMVTIDLFLQSVDSKNSLEDATEMLSIGEKAYIRTLQEAAGLTPTQFYDRFKSGDHLGCFDAPRSLWP